MTKAHEPLPESEPPARPPIRGAAVTALLPSPASATPPGLDGWLAALASWPAGSEILVVTHEPGTGASDPRVRVARHTEARGVGGCLETGLRLVDTPLVVVCATDGRFAAEAAARLFAGIDEADVVVACRSVGPAPRAVAFSDRLLSLAATVFLGGAPDARTAWPGWAGWSRRLAARRLFGVPLSDPGSGLFLARTEIFRSVPVQADGEFAYVELLAKANHLGCLLAESAVLARATPSTPVWSDGLAVFRHPDFGPPRLSRA